MLTKLIEKLNHERKNAIKNGIYHLIQIKFSYNSNRIEGSGLTYEQTAHIFDKSVLITEKNANIKLDDIFETINHFECVNYLLDERVKQGTAKVLKGDADLTKSLLPPIPTTIISLVFYFLIVFSNLSIQLCCFCMKLSCFLFHSL